MSSKFLDYLVIFYTRLYFTVTLLHVQITDLDIIIFILGIMIYDVQCVNVHHFIISGACDGGTPGPVVAPPIPPKFDIIFYNMTDTR